MAPPKNVKPGQKAPASGQYAVKGPRGGTTGQEVTAVKGHRMPPTARPGGSYEIVDRTRNKSGRG